MQVWWARALPWARRIMKERDLHPCRDRRENTQHYSWRLPRARTSHHRKERQNQIHRVVRLLMCVHGRNFADEFLSAFTNVSPSLPHSDQLQIFSSSSCSSWVTQLWDPVCSNKKFTSEGRSSRWCSFSSYNCYECGDLSSKCCGSRCVVWCLDLRLNVKRRSMLRIWLFNVQFKPLLCRLLFCL
jgi:hypothetical protein